MPIPTPFHARTSARCESWEWRNWSGYLAVSVYEPSHEREYYAIRNSAALIDVSPLFKYEVSGPDALRLVNRIMTRDIAKCAVGQVMYTPWCDEDGQVIDDGTVSRLAPDRFRITAADPSLRWFQDCSYGLNAQTIDVSTDLAALALQGPHARDILQRVVTGANLGKLKYYWLTCGQVDGFPLTITRTGYTGDLGYELWVAPRYAERLWDILMGAGSGYGILPVGMVALDIARIEAALLLIEVDYISSHKAVIEAQKSTPYEIGLGWAVKLDKGEFIGRKALVAEHARGSQWTFVGLDIHWESLEKLFGSVGLPPRVAGRASRLPVPVYKHGRQIGQATSRTFSPLLKKYIAIGTVKSEHAKIGSQVDIEVTVEYSRQLATAKIVKTPFFDPPRKKNLGV